MSESAQQGPRSGSNGKAANGEATPQGEAAAPDAAARREEPLPAPAPEPADERGILRRVADEVLDRTDLAGFNRVRLKQAAGLLRHPFAAAGAFRRYAAGTLIAAGATSARVFGAKVEGPFPIPSKDRRFGDRAWEENPFFFGLLQRHMLRERLAQELVDAAGLEEREARKARLASQLEIDASAPSNAFFTNPAAIKRAFESGGLSVLRGLRNFLEDQQQRGGMPRQTDSAAFQVGRNLAVTPGKVVHRNRLMELIQYAPQTPTTWAVPLLCCPPWINKYYIMDLAPGRSFVEWAVKHGHTVFMISYRNPDESMREVAMDDYLLNLDEAVRVVREITGAPKVNLAALCLGGTLATAYLAWLAAGGEDRVGSLTLTNTLVDFSEPGILGCFTDPETLAAVSRVMKKKGFLEAEKMSLTFNLIRANDLIFSYIGSSWLSGEEPPAFDLLAWNGDSTRMPARMHESYLRTCYQENQLARGEMVLGGRRLAPGRVKQDAFVLAAVDDHIAPWKTQFKTTGLLGGKTKFVLSTAGHIAGIVNPPSKNAAHWVNDRQELDPGQWLSGATKKSETWWEEWSRWIDVRAGERGPPPPLGGARHPPLGDSPGSYVQAK